MWWYNIIGDNKGNISQLLQIDSISAGSGLLASNLVAPKRENYEPILIIKRTEWRKFIDYFNQSIEAGPSKAGKKELTFSPYWVYTKHLIQKSSYIKAKAG